jgi:hypothetical protein
MGVWGLRPQRVQGRPLAFLLTYPGADTAPKSREAPITPKGVRGPHWAQDRTVLRQEGGGLAERGVGCYPSCPISTAGTEQ